MNVPDANDREYDVVLHGASGFVGRLTAGHLATHAGQARIALSGRSRERVEAVREELGVDWPVLVTDAADADSVAKLAACTRMVATTVGPYGRYGLPLVHACAEAGTSYADLTGEVLFVRESIARAAQRAQETGARIVHAAGFDSVPSDLGVLLLHERAAADGEGTLEETVLVVVSMRGGVSGGTIDSMRLMVDESRADKQARRVLADPFALDPHHVPGPAPSTASATSRRAADRDANRDADRWWPTRDRMLGRWVAPFVMGSYNSRIVRRSNALLDDVYGPEFHYREVMSTGRGPLAPIAAGAVAAGIIGLVGAMALPPTRVLLDRVLPKPGTGPSAKTQAAGHFRIEIHTRTSTGARYVATVAAQGDPGYAATAIMLGQSALCLGTDELTSPGGVLTPAVAMGDRLVDRLRACGFTLSVRRSD